MMRAFYASSRNTRCRRVQRHSGVFQGRFRFREIPRGYLFGRRVNTLDFLRKSCANRDAARSYWKPRAKGAMPLWTPLYVRADVIRPSKSIGFFLPEHETGTQI